MKARYEFLPLLLLLIALTILAQQPASSGQSRGSRTPEEYVKLLESERRIEGLQVNKVIETLGIKAGDRLADIGAGSGVFARPVARLVGPKGRVYAVDIDPELIRYLEKSAADEKLSNIKTILAPESDPQIPEKVSLIIIIDTMHHIANQPAYVKMVKKYLRPRGRIAVIDFNRNWPAGHEKMIYSIDDLNGWMAAAGFKPVEKYDFLENNFFVVYQ
jgi:cyclopropane fatty-acyl-phospholipid synthase-like methyltransferase